MIYLLVGLLLISFTGTYIIQKIAVQRNVLDIPNERSSHSIPTPRGGGLAIVISWYAGIIVLYLLDVLDKNLFLALLTGILLAIISLLDDIVSLKPLVRFFIQVITAVVAFYFLGGISSVNFTGIEISTNFILYPVSIIGIVWFINLYNFLDGIDAYASIEACFIGLSLFIFTNNIVNLILVASVLGFIYWNRPKAKIFMGDVGSTQLGFILAILGIYFHNTTNFNIVYWIMLTSLFWFDATFTLLRRWRNNENLSEAHKKHTYQRIVQAGFTHAKTVYYSLFINGILFGFVFISYHYRFLQIPAFVGIVSLLFGITRLVDKRKPF